jgi:hypothetical protein
VMSLCCMITILFLPKSKLCWLGLPRHALPHHWRADTTDNLPHAQF